MSEADKQAAKAHATQAAQQGRHAAKNAGKAARLVSEHAVEEGTETVSHVAEVAGEGAQEVAEKTRRFLPRIDTDAFGAFTMEASLGLLFLSLSLYTGSASIKQFQSAFRHGSRVIR